MGDISSIDSCWGRTVINITFHSHSLFCRQQNMCVQSAHPRAVDKDREDGGQDKTLSSAVGEYALPSLPSPLFLLPPPCPSYRPPLSWPPPGRMAFGERRGQHGTGTGTGRLSFSQTNKSMCSNRAIRRKQMRLFDAWNSLLGAFNGIWRKPLSTKCTVTNPPSRKS